MLGAISQIVASDARALGVGAAHDVAAFARAIGSELFEAGSASRSGLFFDRRHGAGALCVFRGMIAPLPNRTSSLSISFSLSQPPTQGRCLVKGHPRPMRGRSVSRKKGWPNARSSP